MFFKCPNQSGCFLALVNNGTSVYLRPMDKLELNSESVPPAPLLEAVLMGALDSVVGVVEALRNKPDSLTFSQNVAAGYWICRNEFSWSEHLKKHNRAVFNSRHRSVVDAIYFFMDSLREDDLTHPKGTELHGGFISAGPVEGEDDPRASRFVGLLLDFVAAYHFLFHYDCKPAERGKVLRLFMSGDLSEHQDWLTELAGRIERRKPKRRSDKRAAAVQV